MYDTNIIFKKIQRGDKKAFEYLFKSLYEELVCYAYKFMKDKDMSEEIVQDVFFKIWMKKNEIVISQNIKSYIYSALKNRCLVIIRHHKVRNEYSRYQKSKGQTFVNDVENKLESNEIENIIEKTLNSLPARMRKIFILNRYEGMKYKEIAEHLSISIKTVEANVSKALKVFRENLSEYVHSS